MKDDLILLRKVYKLGSKCDTILRGILVNTYRAAISRDIYPSEEPSYEVEVARDKLLAFIRTSEKAIANGTDKKLPPV